MTDSVKLSVGFNECTGKIKPMHATNNGPVITGGSESYSLTLLDAERDAEVIGTVRCGEKITLLPNTVCLLKSL